FACGKQLGSNGSPECACNTDIDNEIGRANNDIGVDHDYYNNYWRARCGWRYRYWYGDCDGSRDCADRYQPNSEREPGQDASGRCAVGARYDSEISDSGGSGDGSGQ
ncbi:MAG: hypothetical protein FD187_3232, partial [bacterium]